MQLERRQFPDSFVFGAGVSAYQVEGNRLHLRNNDWDDYYAAHRNHQPYTNKEIGPDWWTYPKAEHDIDIAKDLGLGSLRIGIEWARIEPRKGEINKVAIKRYREIIDYIHSSGLTPLITLNHFTLPYWLGKEGGYTSSNFASSFKRYSEFIADNFGDVKNWLTLNEPTMTLTNQYLSDAWPPRKARVRSAPTVLENMRRANHLAYDCLKTKIPDSEVGSAHTMIWVEPYSRRSLFQKSWASIINYFLNKMPIDKVTEGGNMADFIGFNYYTGCFIKPVPRLTGLVMREEEYGVPKTYPPCFEIVLPGKYRMDTGWPIVPEFFIHSLEYLHKKFPAKPIVITENGIADEKDKYRSFYILTHLAALQQAILKGVDVKGYYYWSSVDNLEFMAGYKYKFGLISIDHETGERKVRPSAQLYKEIATSRQIDVEGLIKKYLPLDQQMPAREVIFNLK